MFGVTLDLEAKNRAQPRITSVGENDKTGGKAIGIGSDVDFGRLAWGDRSNRVEPQQREVGEIVARERFATQVRVDEAETAGVIPRAQEEMLHNVFDFAHHEAADVMVPAPDVAWLEAGLTPEQALERIADQPYSRYPVGDGSLDRIAGIVHLRELVSAGRREPTVPIRSFVHQTFVVPETKDLGALLRELREARQHLAIVVDEYGGTAGIVTLEDILEELVGEIEDEYDLPDDTLERVDERTVRVAGTMTIDDFNETLGTHLDDGDARTLGGLVFNELGRRPREGDEVSAGDVRLRVEQLDGNRIRRLLVQLPAGSGAPRAS